MAETKLVVAFEKKPHGEDEIRLIRAARRDPQAFGALYSLYVGPIFRYLYSRIGNIPEAEDATAQTFLAAFESLDGLREERHFAAWLFTIARHKAMDIFRWRQNSPLSDEAMDIPLDSDLSDEMIRSEQACALASLIQRLPEDERELLRLRFLAELSFGEIGYLLQRKEDTVKKSIYRLLARLHSQLEVSDE
jgi:RNA polymerase sigma-70 factor (ECF subfamily)